MHTALNSFPKCDNFVMNYFLYLDFYKYDISSLTSTNIANGQFFDITLTSVFSHTSHHSTQCWQFSTQQRSSWKIIIMRMTSGLASSCVAFSSDISGRSHAMLLLLEKYNMAAIEWRRLFLYGRDGQHGLFFRDLNPSDHLAPSALFLLG